MKQRILLVLWVSLCLTSLKASTISSRYFVAFTDKKHNGYSVENPSAFLSSRSIERRIRQGIAITESDLPVNDQYINALRVRGAKIICKSKLLNGVMIETGDRMEIEQVASLAFVKAITPLNMNNNAPSKMHKLPPEGGRTSQNQASMRKASFNYGLSYNQVHMISCDYLHDFGYDGAGKIIALLDAGFYRVDSLDAFDSIRTHNQILGTWDFVDNEADVYNDHTHGMNVLSCIAANLPGTLVGTAPHASFFLLRSEDDFSETLAEEYYWAAAAEYADSAGADIISSSLGYTTFDDTLQNHSYADMNGHTTVAALAANHAASAGMLVVVSAGNTGASYWNYIVTPADADSALAIGAVDANGAYAFFSGNGPSSDGDVKPNVATQGEDTYLYFSSGFVGTGNGTSFSAPILAGAAACLWQAFDTLTNMELFQSIQQCASQYFFPDTLLGYGIPNFMSAFTLLSTRSITLPVPDGIVNVFPVPLQDQITVIYNSPDVTPAQATVYDILGHQVYSVNINLNRGIQSLNFNLGKLAKGIYYLDISAGGMKYTKSLVKN